MIFECAKVEGRDEWVVEAIGRSEGLVFGATFMGVNAEWRAKEYAAFKNAQQAQRTETNPDVITEEALRLMEMDATQAVQVQKDALRLIAEVRKLRAKLFPNTYLLHLKQVGDL